MKHHSFVFLFIFASFEAITALEPDFFGGVVLPSEIAVAVEESIYLKIKKPIDMQTSCAYQAPGKKELNSPDSSVKFTDDKCGIRIDNVAKAHEGVWKLISTFKNSTFENSIKGTSVVKVKDRVQNVLPKQENRIYASNENFAPFLQGYNMSYCFVLKNAGSTKMVEIDNSKCMIPQDLDSDFRDGEWMVKMGVQGESQEISFSVNIQSKDEAIETVIKRNDNTHIQLLCRVKNLRNVLKFCRFKRVGDDDGFGLNLEDGIASGNYLYHGEGFANGDCGMEIKNMKEYDKVQWRCFVGLWDYDDAMNDKLADDKKKLYKHSAVVDASNDWNKLKILNEDTDLYLVDNQSAVIQCNANNPFDYCWFQHPVHRILSVSDKKPSSDDDNYQYYGEGFILGHCGIKIKRIYFADAGNWKCGVGRVSELMKEAVKTIKVDVRASFMMALTKQIEDFSKNSIALQCQAIPKGSSLASCHFLTPSGEAFSISEKVTKSDAIDGNYYFDPNRKLSDGFCTVVINELDKNEHSGKWICSGRIFGQDDESYDSIYVTVDGLRGASFSYLSLAIVLPLVAVLALSALVFQQYRKRRSNVRSSEASDDISMHTIGSNNTETTTSSEDSRESTSHLA